jgi:hypothetical protein
MTNGSENMVMPVAPMYGSGNGFGNSWGGDGRYSEDSSYRRGRDSMGRYTSLGTSYDDGYSRHSKDEMIEHLQEMMRNARNDEEKESYRRAIEQMKR